VHRAQRVADQHRVSGAPVAVVQQRELPPDRMVRYSGSPHKSAANTPSQYSREASSSMPSSPARRQVASSHSTMNVLIAAL
jgi:hypothetical protein